MSEKVDKFLELKKLDVNKHTEKKGKLVYLSWAAAWGIFKEHLPDAKYSVERFDGKPYLRDEAGLMVFTEITAGGETHQMWLPVMDFNNKVKKDADYFDINKTIMRCLAKNMAMFGLGLYIYQGEDLPEGEKDINDTGSPFSRETLIDGVDQYVWTDKQKEEKFNKEHDRLMNCETVEELKKQWASNSRKTAKDLKDINDPRGQTLVDLYQNRQQELETKGKL